MKREVADIGEESSSILKLRPVSFFDRSDEAGIRQYGLIAEEAAQVMPGLVEFTQGGEPETVRYHFLAPLLLNELQKQHETIESQRQRIAGLEARLEAVEAGVPGRQRDRRAARGCQMSSSAARPRPQTTGSGTPWVFVLPSTEESHLPGIGVAQSGSSRPGVGSWRPETRAAR